MNHIIWPEGQPEEGWQTENTAKAFLRVAMMQIIQLAKLSSARRMRWAIGSNSMEPADIEEVLRRAGGIAPPGGWHKPRSGPLQVAEDLHVRTHSII